MKHAHTRSGWVKGSRIRISADLSPQLPNPSHAFPVSQDVSLRLRFYRYHPPLLAIFTSIGPANTTGGPDADSVPPSLEVKPRLSTEYLQPCLVIRFDVRRLLDLTLV